MSSIFCFDPGHPLIRFCFLGFFCFSGFGSAFGETLQLVMPETKPDVELPARTIEKAFSIHPQGMKIGYTNRYLTLDSSPWMPVMGEFHFSRSEPGSWELELEKMKAGGIDVVATYVFWIHHEEKPGEWNWEGARDLNAFVKAVERAGLQLILRVGPWCHGEVRNGGLPDWILQGNWKARSNDPSYLEHVETWYAKIENQVEGMMWKDGGPIVGIQLDNEYGGPAAHLLELKRIAIEKGLQTPIYTRTGWPKLQDRMPFGEMLPLFGVYAEGFWNHSLEAMPGRYREGFHFSTIRTSSDIGSDQLGKTLSEDESDAQQYPYLTCEVGGGMMNSYHRRVLIDAKDVYSTALVKLGSGGNLLGYYMYHGGLNPVGGYSTLQESLETHYPNDMPVKNYDFQAPVGAAGKLREHYHDLRQLHLFIRDYQSWLATLAPFLPEDRPSGLSDTETFRWSIRSNGAGGLVFFNNHERLQPLESHQIKFHIEGLTGSDLIFPSNPVTIESGDLGFWLFRSELAPGFPVEWLTAQPICHLQTEDGNWVVFVKQTGAVPVELALLESEALSWDFSETGESEKTAEACVVLDIPSAGLDAAIELSNKTSGTRYSVVVLDESIADALWKGEVGDEAVVVCTEHDIVFSDSGIDVRLSDSKQETLSILRSKSPLGSEPLVAGDKLEVHQSETELWTRFQLPSNEKFRREIKVQPKQVQQVGVLRAIPLGPYRSKVAMAPVDEDFESASKWSIPYPEVKSLEPWNEVVLDVSYLGDVLRVSVGDQLIMDDFYNGRNVEFALKPMLASSEVDWESADALMLELLPLQKDAPIYLHPRVREQIEDLEESNLCDLKDARWILRNPISIVF